MRPPANASSTRQPRSRAVRLDGQALLVHLIAGIQCADSGLNHTCQAGPDDAERSTERPPARRLRSGVQREVRSTQEANPLQKVTLKGCLQAGDSVRSAQRECSITTTGAGARRRAQAWIARGRWPSRWKCGGNVRACVHDALAAEPRDRDPNAAAISSARSRKGSRHANASDRDQPYRSDIPTDKPTTCFEGAPPVARRR